MFAGFLNRASLALIPPSKSRTKGPVLLIAGVPFSKKKKAKIFDNKYI